MQNDFEELSSAHDGEGNTQDLLRMLDAIDSDADSRERDSLYRLIGDTLRDPGSPVLGTDVTRAVMRSVAREPVPHVPEHDQVSPFVARRSDARHRHPVVRSFSATAAAVAAVAFISALVWRGVGVNADPVVAYVVFEQPRTQPQVVQMDAMPPELVEYLLAHRQNSAVGTINTGSAVIRAGADDSSLPTNARAVQNRGGDMEWVRLWDNRPVYVTNRTVER